MPSLSLSGSQYRWLSEGLLSVLKTGLVYYYLGLQLLPSVQSASLMKKILSSFEVVGEHLRHKSPPHAFVMFNLNQTSLSRINGRTNCKGRGVILINPHRKSHWFPHLDRHALSASSAPARHVNDTCCNRQSCQGRLSSVFRNQNGVKSSADPTFMFMDLTRCSEGEASVRRRDANQSSSSD